MIVSELRDDVAMGLSLLTRALKHTQESRDNPNVLNFAASLLQEESWATVEEVTSLRARMVAENILESPKVIQAVLRTKVGIFCNWIDTVTSHVSRVSPQSAASLDDLRQAFVSLFQRDLFDTVYHFETGGTAPSQLEGYTGTGTGTLARTRSEMALQHIAYQPQVKSVLREVEHLLRVGITKLDVKASTLRSVTMEIFLGLLGKGLITYETFTKIESDIEMKSRAPDIVANGLAVVAVFNVDLNKGVEEEAVFGFSRLDKSVYLDYEGQNHEIQFVALFVCPNEAEQHAHVWDIGNELVRLVSDREFKRRALLAKMPDDIRQAVNIFIGDELVGGHEEHEDGLEYTGGPLTGIIADLKRRKKHYWDDWKSGWTPKSVIIFSLVFLAALAPAIAFGELLNLKTDGKLGIVEMLESTGFVMIVYSIFGGQPVIIMGGTGPLLVFTGTIKTLAKTVGVDFFPLYTVVGLWIAGFLFIVSMFNMSRFIRHMTRFTDDIFELLISAIFISEPIVEYIKKYETEYKDEGSDLQRDKSLLWLLLVFCAVFMTHFIMSLRNRRFLSKGLRRNIGNFSMILTMIILSLLAEALFPNAIVHVEIPEIKSIDTVDPSGMPTWVYFAAAGPAFLGAALIYLEHNITAKVILGPENKLKKGASYHWDMLVVSGMIALCSMVGLPWLVAATVRTAVHLRSLTKYKTSRSTEKFFSQPQILRVTETRLTGFAIGALMLITLSFVDVLEAVPVPVISGIFFFMGLNSLAGNQFYDRILLMFMDWKLIPEESRSRVSRATIYKFTLIQIVCFSVLLYIKFSEVAIFFPLGVVLLIPFRWLLSRYVFSQHDLAVLDAH